MSSINIALPAMEREFAIDAIMLGWITTSYMLAAAIFLVPLGKAADIVGRKRVFTAGIAFHIITSVLAALSPSAPALILFRFLQGIASAMIFGTGIAILASVYPVKERGKALGITTAAVYLGLSTGPVLGGLLTQHIGWRSIFWITIPPALLLIMLVLWKLKGEWSEAKEERFDFWGSVIYSLSLAALVYGFSHLPELPGFLLVFAGVMGFIGFVYWGRNRKDPLIDINLFLGNRAFTLFNLAALISYSATYAVVFLLSLYLQYNKMFDPQAAGLILIAQPAVMALLSPFAGRLSDRIEPRLLASVGMVLMAVALFGFAFLKGESTIIMVVLLLMVLGAGIAFFSSPNTNAIMSAVDKKYYGLASATLQTMRVTGNVLSMGIVMMVFTLFMGRVQISATDQELFLASTRTIFLVFTALSVAGVFASLVKGRNVGNTVELQNDM